MNTATLNNKTVDLETLLNRTIAYRLIKRLMDVAIASTALLILAPLLLTVALIIKLTSKGNVLYFQKRVGLNGQLINFPKFRSMVQDADDMINKIKKLNDHQESVTFKMKNDPRVTAIGKIIRKLSIDELPQLWLVLKGDMTLVGPRPALPREVAKYTPREKQRLLVKPGLTCIWQVSGRGDVPFDRQVEMDFEYINNRSVKLDVKLLFLTVPAVVLGKGAY